MKSITRLACATIAAAAIPAALLYVGALACGPFFEPEVFVPRHHPASRDDYGAGRLGIVQRSYYHAELVVAYRYLSGAPLSREEQMAYSPAPGPVFDAHESWQVRHEAEEAKRPVNQWRKLRSSMPAAAPVAEISQERVTKRDVGNYSLNDYQLNCTDGAFTNAIATLEQRTKTWGAASPHLQEWLRGQDAVFDNCNGPLKLPSPAAHDWPALLQQDRAYQIAAAEFYAGRFDDAVRDFEAIARDHASPWRRWGEYLAARAEVRKAASNGKAADFGEQATFDMAGLKAAGERLSRLLATTPDPEIQHAANAELQFVQVRLSPGQRLDDAAEALAGPKPDREFQQDLTDLDFLLDRGATGTAALVRWIQSMQGSPDKQAVGEGAPWLVSRISAAPAPDAQLLAAAAAVPATSPAYLTVQYHRARLLRSAGKLDDARSVLTAMLVAVPAGDAASRNATLQQRMPTARTLDEFLADAPRIMMEPTSEAASLAQCTSSADTRCTAKLPPLQFDNDAAAAFNQQLPLSAWVQAAKSTTLPPHLRDAIAWAGWLRAIGLNDPAARTQLAPMLPPQVRSAVGTGDGFPATLALLRTPGLQPYLLQGVQRSASYATLESFRDNWWCSKWGDGVELKADNSPDLSVAPAPPPLPFLTPAQRRAADAERTKLNALPNATIWLGQRALDYVKQHPDGADAAEALALVVRAAHYSCSGQESGPQRAISKEAFELLHRRYPNTEWARKTKYYY